MEEKMKLLDELKAFSERNYPEIHVVIIEDVINQFKKKLIIEKNSTPYNAE